MTIKAIVKKFLERVRCKCACFSNCKLEIAYNASMRKKSKKSNENNNENNNTNINNVVVNNPNNEGRALPGIPTTEQNIYVSIE